MSLALALSIFVFLTIVVIVFAFGAASVAPSSVLGSRLREIGWQRPKAQAKPAIRERMQQALDPFSRALPLSPTDVSQTRAWLIQAGYRDPQHVTIYRGLRVLFAALGFFSVFLFTGFDSPLLLIGLTAFGFFLPRFLLKKKLQERQRRIRLGLPDALDLTVICVEAGLSLDQAMMRVGQDLSHAHPDLSGEFHLFDLGSNPDSDRPLRNQRCPGLACAFRFPAYRTPPARRRTSRQNDRQNDYSPSPVCDALPDFRHRRPSRNSIAAHIRPGCWGKEVRH